MPPDSPLWKNSSSVTSFAWVWWAMKTISTALYLVQRNWNSRKKKLRARYFFSRSIEPEVSMMQMTTALLSSRSSSTRRL